MGIKREAKVFSILFPVDGNFSRVKNIFLHLTISVDTAVNLNSRLKINWLEYLLIL